MEPMPSESLVATQSYREDEPKTILPCFSKNSTYHRAHYVRHFRRELCG